MYFNKKQNRSGVLFESRYKSKWIDNDNYLKYIFSYIHLNPVKLIRPNWRAGKLGKAELKDIHEYLSDYKYSSYLDYTYKFKSVYLIEIVSFVASIYLISCYLTGVLKKSNFKEY